MNLLVTAGFRRNPAVRMCICSRRKGSKKKHPQEYSGRFFGFREKYQSSEISKNRFL